MRKVKFFNEYLYHIYNRGVDKRPIFMDDADRYRFIHSLYEFNHKENVTHLIRKVEINGRCRGSTIRDPLVHIVNFSMLSNHFHLILNQRLEGGVEQFMRKLGTGYAKYFNKRYERTGAFFEGRFKAKWINSQEYLLHLSRYIHLNPLNIIEPGWKKEGIRNLNQVKEFLESYRWSSFMDCMGIKNFPSVINQKSILDNFTSRQEYKKFVLSWVADDLEKLRDYFS